MVQHIAIGDLAEFANPIEESTRQLGGSLPGLVDFVSARLCFTARALGPTEGAKSQGRSSEHNYASRRDAEARK